MTFTPKYTITAKLMNAISAIEVSRQAVNELPINAQVLASLRESARISSTHHSTAIEGNTLSVAEVKEVVQEGNHFPHREKDEKEVLNYYSALDYVETLVKNKQPLNEIDIQTLHGISFRGTQSPTVYRDAQNVIRSGKLVVYIPPKAADVPSLMKDLLQWILSSIEESIPIPIVAGLAHYQFATIHPYYDGNGRTARLLVTLILQKYGYGLKGIYSLEEYYALNLEAYYGALSVGSDEDYYDGNRESADLTEFLDYFIGGMAKAFIKVKTKAQESQNQGSLDQSFLLRELAPQQKQVLKLFLTSKEITTKQIAEHFQVSARQARNLCAKWVFEGFISISNPSPKTRTYKLSNKYESLVVASINH